MNDKRALLFKLENYKWNEWKKEMNENSYLENVFLGDKANESTTKNYA